MRGCLIITSITNGLYKFTDCEFISPSIPMDKLYLPMVNWLTIGTDGQCLGGLPYAIAIILTASFTNGIYKFTDGEFDSPSIPMDNLYLPMVNWLTIGTGGNDGQCLGGLPYAIAIMLTTSFTNGLYKFSDGEFISPSVPVDNLYLPMVNWLTIGTDGYRRTVFWRATLCHCNNANYLIHQRTLQIYRWLIHFSIGTGGQSLFTDGELAYHRYRRYRRTVFWRATLCHCIKWYLISKKWCLAWLPSIPHL